MRKAGRREVPGLSLRALVEIRLPTLGDADGPPATTAARDDHEPSPLHQFRSIGVTQDHGDPSHEPAFFVGRM